MSFDTFVLTHDGGHWIENVSRNHSSPMVHLDQTFRDEKLERILEKAARARELAERQRERALRNAERARRNAERARQRANGATHFQPDNQIDGEDLKRLLELLKMVQEQPRSGNSEQTPLNQECYSPPSIPLPKAPFSDAVSSTPSGSIFGKVTTHKLGIGMVRYITIFEGRHNPVAED